MSAIDLPVSNIQALPGSCARATTAKETAYRLNYPLVPARRTRVVSLDDGAEAVVRAAEALEWNDASFYREADSGRRLIGGDGASHDLESVLDGSDTLILLASEGGSGAAASVIASECRARGVMTAGLDLNPGSSVSDAVLMLRPYARMLLVGADGEDLIELLTAMRA